MITSRKDESGVTLIELVVVATLVAILSAILYGVLSGLIRARDATEKVRDAETTAHYLFARMTRELSSTSKSLTPLSTNKASTQGSAVSGSSFGSTSLYFEGINTQSGEFARDSIRFVSSNAAQPFVDGPANYGTVEIRYSLRDTSGDEALRAGVETTVTKSGKTMVLVREEIPAAINNNADLQKKRQIVLPLAGNVAALNFRFLKDGKWKNEWKELTPPLPEAIEITLGLEETDGSIEYYRTALPMAPRNKPKAGASQTTPTQ